MYIDSCSYNCQLLLSIAIILMVFSSVCRQNKHHITSHMKLAAIHLNFMSDIFILYIDNSMIMYATDYSQFILIAKQLLCPAMAVVATNVTTFPSGSNYIKYTNYTIKVLQKFPWSKCVQINPTKTPTCCLAFTLLHHSFQ